MAVNKQTHDGAILRCMYHREFNELVNMEPDELKHWLTGDTSLHAGWPKNDGSGETVGHERYKTPRPGIDIGSCSSDHIIVVDTSSRY